MSTDTQLPSPQDRPDADVVIYDGQCGICTAQINKLPWWDCQQRLSYVSLHDAEVSSMPKAIGIGAPMPFVT